MTKASQPSPVQGIRYFEGSGYGYVNGCHEAIAFGRRVALLLRSRGYSFGPWHHLYIRAVERAATDCGFVATEGVEWWHRFVEFTVPPGFAAMGEGERSRILIAGTCSVLRSLFPKNDMVLVELLAEAEKGAERLRFLVKRKILGGRSFEASFNVAAWPEHSDLRVVVKDEAAGVDLVSPPIKLKIYSDAFSLASDIRQQGDAVSLVPRKSFTAQLVAAQYEGALTLPLAAFRPVDHLPPISQLISGLS